MGIDVQQPLFFLLAIPALLVVVHWWRTQRQMPTSRKALIASLRSAVFLLLILVVAGVQLLFPVQEKTVVFVVDQSASMKDDPRLEAFMREAVSQKRPNDRYAVVVVGSTAAVDQPFTIRNEVQQIGVEVNRHASNLADGIRLAAAMVPSNARGKVVLLSDGIETHGDAGKETRLVTERGISVEAVSFQQPQGDEVLLSSVQVPQQLYAGEEFSIRVDVESSTATPATLRLYEGNREAGRLQVQLDKGRNQFLFSETAMEEGFHRYRVEVEAVRDTVQANNTGSAFTQVAGVPAVMVVEGTPGAADNLVSALAAGNMRVEPTDLALLPKELDGYKQYAAIVLANVSATQMAEADMERIRTAVRDLGIGLIMTGGSESFGMGGWFQTPIEEALPVHMDLRGKEELPSLGLQLVIDKSGSMSGGGMGVDKMELAKEAAIRATMMLQPQDQIGVIAFDGTPWEVVAPQNVTDLPSIHQSIGRIVADGGTDIYPALEMGYGRVAKMNAQRKHVILLTDGHSGLEDNYEALLQRMVNESVTVSTVAVGDDADTQLMEAIAEWGNGRYYHAEDVGSLPTIFSKETALASRTFIVEKPQIPERTGAGLWPALRESIPPLRAYVATTPKQTAEVSLVSADDDPILARWQYGLGRAVAWTSDLEGKWAPDWVSWGGMSRLWNEIIAWSLPQIESGTWKTQTSVDNGKGKVTVTVPTGVNMPQELDATVVNQQMERELIRLKPIAPGVWEGEFPAAEPGSYLIQITEKANGQVIAGQTTGLTVAYSPEYAMPKDGEQVLKSWLEAGGGALLTAPAEVFSRELPPKWETQPIGEWLLMLAALLWPLDVAARRLQLPERWWTRFMPGKQRARQSEARSDQQSVLAKLQQKRGSQQPSFVERERLDPLRQAETATTRTQTAASGKKSSQAEQVEKQPEPQEQADETLNRLLAAKKRKNRP